MPKVLLIDDEVAILDVLEMLLVSEGYDVYKSNSGEAGLKIAEKHIPDIIILDIMMPKMSGYMVSNLLTKNNKLKHIPILLLTATSQMAGNIILQTQAQHKLSKPFKPEELLMTLKTMLSANKTLS
tara:strand:- start:215 stop:592 length:378 start_codon:yes stop_codon:yes gene_type:complete